MKQPVFYCDSCGLPVPKGSSFCPHCGDSFSGVRCPSCGFQGEEKTFKKGCPACGFLAVPGAPPAAPAEPAKAVSVRDSGADKSKKKKASLPGWVYAFSITGLVFLIVLFLVIFVFQVTY